MNNLTIYEWIPEYHWVAFRHMCADRNLLYMTELMPLIDELQSWEGIGPKRYAELRDKLLPYNTADIKNYRLTIAGAFNPPAFVKFRLWCKEQGFQHFDELNEEIFNNKILPLKKGNLYDTRKRYDVIKTRVFELRGKRFL